MLEQGTIRVKSHDVAPVPVAVPAVAASALMPVVSDASTETSASGRCQPSASNAPPAPTVGGVSSRTVATAL